MIILELSPDSFFSSIFSPASSSLPSPSGLMTVHLKGMCIVRFWVKFPSWLLILIFAAPPLFVTFPVEFETLYMIISSLSSAISKGKVGILSISLGLISSTCEVNGVFYFALNPTSYFIDNFEDMLRSLLSVPIIVEKHPELTKSLCLTSGKSVDSFLYCSSILFVPLLFI